MANIAANEILKHWQKAGPSAWWKKDLAFDEDLRNRFGELHQRASEKSLDNWREEPHACLALVIVLDQFSRNLFRNDAQTFAQDPYSLELAKYAISKGYEKLTPEDISGFFYLPYMHSENLPDQETCVSLIRKNGNKYSLKAAIEHRDIVAEFGRFPHRNSVLGRQTTAQEQAFLDAGGFAG